MSIALALSVLLVYLLMVALYDSYRTPFIIMFSVPVAIVGALGALALDPGADAERSLGTVVIGGLSSSLVLTLLIVPVVCLWLAPRRLPEDERTDRMALPLDGSRADVLTKT